jgi:hypothetical protein
MMPEMQDKPMWLATMNRLKAVRFSLFLGSSLEEGGGLNFRCASVKSRGLIEALNS